MKRPLPGKPPAGPGGRELKRLVAEQLSSEDFGAALRFLLRMPARQVVNPLFGLFCHRSLLVRWRAVTAMGAVTAALAERETESARVIVRRFMWNLNEESGGIGWGCPEALGETLARSPRLAEEYHCILASYLNPRGNFIENPLLQEGVLWGLGRLGHSRPACLSGCSSLIAPFFSDAAAPLRGLAAWTAGAAGEPGLLPGLEALASDGAVFGMYRGERLVERSVAELARQAADRIRRAVEGR